jgi:hypothetical protein
MQPFLARVSAVGTESMCRAKHPFYIRFQNEDLSLPARFSGMLLRAMILFVRCPDNGCIRA